MEQQPLTPAGEPSPTTPDAVAQGKSARLRIATLGFFLFLVFTVGLFWYATSPGLTVGLTLSFVSGLSMIFLPCTLPLAFVIVPLTLGKDPKKGLGMALSFAFGLTLTLSFYGIFMAAVGKTFGLKSDVEVWAALLGGTAALIFGLSEIGLLKFKLPSYSGKFPDFIQRRKDYMKTFLLGLLLGNAGVGCPNPAFYLLLGYIATTGDLFNGWFLGFVHGMGRSVPLIFLAILGTLGINALSGLSRHKETVERAMGWMLVIIGSYLLTFGIFGHDWFVAGGMHTSWERLMVRIGGERFGETILQHQHRLVDLPDFIQYGNMFFLVLLALTMLAGFVITRPPKRTIKTLIVIYAVIALLIGYTTGWTYRIGTNVHMEDSTAAHPSGEAAGPHAAAYHEELTVKEGITINLNVAPVPVKTGQSTRLDFFVNEKPAGTPVTDLEIEHTKYMHVIGVRSDMEEFFHIHPKQSVENMYSIPPKPAPEGWQSINEAGFSILIPPSWRYSYSEFSSSPGVLIRPFDESGFNNKSTIAITSSDNEGLTVDEFVNRIYPDIKPESKKATTVAEQRSMQVKYRLGEVGMPTYSMIEMYVPHQSSVYRFKLSYLQGDANEERIIKDFISMLETVTFVESTEQQPGFWTVDHTFSKPGLYKIWSEVKRAGVNHSFGHPEISVQGEGEKSTKQVSAARKTIIDNYHVSLDIKDPVVKGREQAVSFDIHTSAGQEVEVEPYLGADMHLTIIKDDLKQFIHTHPEIGMGHDAHSQGPALIPAAHANGEDDHEDEMPMPGEHGITFRPTFPEAGLYKMFAQFRPKGSALPPDNALTVSFWVEVKDKAPAQAGVWWGLLAVSSAAMVGLSFGVKRYIERAKTVEVTKV